MKSATSLIAAIGSALIGLLCSNSLIAASIGQWDFDSGNLSASAGATLGPITYADGPGGATQGATVFGSTATLGIPAINGTVANVMKFPGATSPRGYFMPVPPLANGGGSTVENYTILFDVLYPSNGLFRPLIQTDDGGDGTIAYLAISKGDQIGATNNHTILPSGYSGQILANTWYRIGFVVNQSGGQLISYINGVQVGVLNGIGAIDNPYTLVPGLDVKLLSNIDTNVAAGYVNSVQIRDVALNSGQMSALGGPSASGIPITIPAVPSFIASRKPDLNDTGIHPTPNLHVVIDQGDTTIASGTVSLALDGTTLPANISGPANNQLVVDYNYPTILDPLSSHTLTLRYQDSVAGFKTNTWSFTVANYQNVTLPAPIYLETFDELAEGALPTGWSVTNNTIHQVAGFDLNNPKSDAYLDWVVITSNRLASVFPFDGYRRLILPPIVLNGVVLDRLVHGNLAWAETDQRSNDGGQVNVMFTSDYDLTGKTNVFVAFKNTYEQNQDNINSLEYSIDEGVTWLPVLYFFDDGNSNPADNDIVRTNGVIDVGATFNTARGDQAWGLPYRAFIGATVSTNLIPAIKGRLNDDPLDGKRIEVVRLAQADGRPKVRFRFGQAGTSSWYQGIDDFGLYSINTPVISVPPLSQTIDAGTPVTFSVTAVGGGPLTYQWKFNGNTINGATSQSYTIDSVSPADAGNYTVVVSNPDGPAQSPPAQLTVITLPSITAQPLSQVADPGATITFSTSTRGGRPLTHVWYFNGAPVGGNTNNLVLNNVQAANSGTYQMILSNAYGSVTSSVVRLTVFSGDITNCLVVHLGFDSTFTDTSGRNNNATYAHGGVNGDPTPTFVAGQIGQAFQFTTLQDGTKFNYATLGYPNDLKFGASNDFSVSMWVNYNNQIDDPPFISNKDWASSDNPGWGIFTQGGPNFRVNITGLTTANKMSTTATAPVRDGTWHNIVVSALRNGLVYIYVDGALVNTTPLLVQGTIDTDAAPLNYRVNIGQDGRGDYTDGGGAQIVDAKIDDLGIWCRGLTAHEAASIYAQGLSHNDLSTANGSQITPPTIGTQPISRIVTAGGSVSLTVGGSGIPPLTYRWQRNGVDVGGATSATLTIDPVQVANAGAYQAIVTNPGGSVTSKVVQVSVVTSTICQGLVAHLTFDNDLADTSGHANHAQYAGHGASASPTPSFVPGKLGQAFRFTTMLDGSKFEYATFGYPPDLKFDTNDFSVSFWVNYDNSIDDPPYLSNKDWNSSNNTGWGLFTQEGGNLRVVATGTPRGSANKMDAVLGQIVRDSTWHHIAASFWRGQNTFTYIDGTIANVAPLVISGSVDTTYYTNVVGTVTNVFPFAVNIGQDGRGDYTDNGSAQIVNCAIDDLGIWRRALTPQDISGIYTSGVAGRSLPSVRFLNIINNGATMTLNWVGTCSSYTVQHKSALTDLVWIDDGTTTASSLTVPKSGNARFYRINAN